MYPKKRERERERDRERERCILEKGQNANRPVGVGARQFDHALCSCKKNNISSLKENNET